MMARIQTNSTEVITTTITLLGVVQTGLSDVILKIQRTSDDFLYDFNDNAFKASGWTDETQAMTEVDATNLPGQYKYSFDTSAISNATADDNYICRVDCASGDNDPLFGEIKLGQFVDDIDAPISTVDTVVDAIKAKTDNLPTDPADESLLEAAITASEASIIAEVDANETKIDALQTNITEILGLVQSNFLIDTVVNDSSGNMTSSRLRIFPTKTDKENETNVIHTYTISATYDSNDYCTGYSCVKDS